MAKWQRVRIDLPEDLGAAAREAIGVAIRNRMQERAQSGVGVDASGERSKRFPPYSPEYLEYKSKRRSSGSLVNLTFDADMLSAMQYISSQKGSVLIGMDRKGSNFTEENAKAEGNILGSYGRSPNPSKARNFMGLPRHEVERIINEYRRGRL